ncbi:hypothetical protein SpCBS45565_g01121 [Spizellomyces sp. 'palustris']|nr:hypothetical protein SpCBS45565_g01121 [Spizellomyces sp. 'palustris']
MSSASFRTSTFDPVLIAAQIVALQSTYYLSASLIVFVLELLTGSPVTLNHVLMHDELRTDTVLGWSLFLAYLMNAGLGSYYLLIIVQRAKLCLDFSCTLHILHIFITTLGRVFVHAEGDGADHAGGNEKEAEHVEWGGCGRVAEIDGWE